MTSRAAVAASSSARAAGVPPRALITTTSYTPCSSRALLLARAHAASSARGDGLSPAKPAAVPATTAAAAAAATMLAMPQAAHAASTSAVAATAASGSPLFLLPPMTPGHIALLALASLNLLAGFSEGSGQNTPYSKFSPTQQQKKQDGGGAAAAPAPRVVSSRDGMALIYAGGLAVSLLAPLVLPGSFGLPAGAADAATTATALLSSAPTARPALVALLLALHFAKRELEVFFLHRYSGGMPLTTAVMISTVYTVTSLQYLYFAHVTASAAAASGGAFALSPAAAVAGLALFVVGQLGNLYHHWLLAQLRSSSSSSGSGSSSSKSYSVPRGGLFGLVAAPHYLFEIVAWLGMALATQSVVPLVSALGMGSYLAGRSASTLRWNRANIPGYPADRKRLVPFVW